MEQERTSSLVSNSGPLVSIVIPTFNRAHMLPAAINACLAQTYKNIELIVINDGSKDNTEEIMQQFASSDPRVQTFSKANEGIADTLNYGHERARGEYVTWTSDDNMFYPEAIEAMVNFLQNHPGIGMVYTDMRFIDENDNELRIVHTPDPEELESKCGIQCVLYRRGVFEKAGGFNRKWIRCQDFDYYLRVIQHFKAARIPRVLYDYRWHQASMSGNHEAAMLEDADLRVFYAKSLSEKRAIRAHNFAYLGRHFENRCRHWKAVYYYLRAMSYSPKRMIDFGRTFFYALYNSLPESAKRMWRSVKNGSPRAIN